MPLDAPAAVVAAVAVLGRDTLSHRWKKEKCWRDTEIPYKRNSQG
jgi:hypothetical protein